MTSLVFETPGLIDMRAFTLMGVSSKPNSTNPIGYFGTGLKYAVAVLVRLGCEPRVWVGEDEYVFTKSSLTFRDKEFTMIGMRARKLSWRGWRHTVLPYSTEYGKNWEPWMVYRELASNTMDEGGRVFVHNSLPIGGAPGITRILVDEPGVLKAHEDRATIFLPEARREGAGVQVVDRPSEHLYWRGMRVFKTGKPCMFTYNFLDQAQLTEDRTLQGDWTAKYLLGNHVLRSDDEAFIQRIITADKEYWEADITYSDSLAPSRAYHNVMQRHPKNVSMAAWMHYGKHDERVTEETFVLAKKHPYPWKVEGTRVLDAQGSTVFEAPFGYGGKWELMAQEVLNRLLVTKEAVAAPAEEPEAEGQEVEDVA